MVKSHGVLKSTLLGVLFSVWAVALCPLQAFQNGVVLSQEEAKVATLWQRYLDAKSSEDADAVKSAFEGFQRLQKTTSSEIFETAAYLFLEEGYRELATGDHEAARSEFLKAAELDRYLWPAYAGLAKIKKERDRNLQRALYLDFKGISEAFSLENAYFLLDVAVWFYQNLYYVFFFAFIAFALILSQKYFKPFYHTAVSGLEQKGMRSLYATLPALAILLTPLILGVNLFFVGGLYLVLAFPFMNTKEKYATGAVFVLLMPISILILLLANANDARTDPLLRAHLTQYFDGNLERRIQFLAEEPGDGEFKNRSLLALADLLKVKGDYDQALEIYAKIPQSSELWSLAQINGGNIHYLLKDYQSANEFYERAMKAQPGLALSYYNIAVVKERSGNTQEAEAFRNQALKKDPTLGMRAALDRGLVEQDVLDARPDNRRRIIQAMMGQGNPNTQGWAFDPYFFMPIVMGLVFLCLALVHLRYRNPSLLAKACERCGNVFFPSDSPNSEWCSQCVSLYIKKEDLPSEAKLQKSEEVRRFSQRKKWIGLVLQIICPGSKKVLGSNAIEGVITIFVWMTLVIFCLFPLTGIQYPFMRYLDGSLIISVISYGVTAVFWLLFGLRPAFGED